MKLATKTQRHKVTQKVLLKSKRIINRIFHLSKTYGKFSPVPVFLTEDLYHGDVRYREAIISYLEAKKISWSVWCFSVIWTPALLADKNFTPTEAGAFFRQKLLEKTE